MHLAGTIRRPLLSLVCILLFGLSASIARAVDDAAFISAKSP